jgi:hypothetical protein
MGGLKINFAEVEGSFEPLPEGQYEVIIERVEVRESNSSDNDYLNWQLKVTDDGEFEDRNLWMITSLSEKALFRLKDVLVALEVIEEDEELELEWADDVDITPKEGPLVTNPELDGLAAIAVVTNEMYDGRERNRVNDLVAADAAPAKKSPAKGGKGKAAAKKSGGRSRKLR